MTNLAYLFILVNALFVWCNVGYAQILGDTLDLASTSPSMTVVSVDSNSFRSATVNYKLMSASITSATFSAPGNDDKQIGAKSAGSKFSVSFDQASIPIGTSRISLNYRYIFKGQTKSKTLHLSVIRTGFKTITNVSNVVIFQVPETDDVTRTITALPPILGNHRLEERFTTVVYNAKTASNSKLVQPFSCYVTVSLPKIYTPDIIGLSHHYNDPGQTVPKHPTLLSTKPQLLAPDSATIYFESQGFSNAIPVGLTLSGSGQSSIAALIYTYEGGGIKANTLLSGKDCIIALK